MHRLVARCYVKGRTNDKCIICHKDDNPKNNYYKNLEWGTSQKNNMDAVRRGLKKNVNKIKCIETGEIFCSPREAARRMFGIARRGDHILMAAKGERGKAYGYHWEIV